MFSRSTTSTLWRRGSQHLSRTGLIAVLLVLSACSSVPPRVEAASVPLPQPPAPILPLPTPVSLNDVKWRVIQQVDAPLFCVSAQGYEDLSRNLAEIGRWMKESSWQLDFYRDTRTGVKP